MSRDIVKILQKISQIKVAFEQKMAEKIDAAKILNCCRNGVVPPSPSTIAVAVDDIIGAISERVNCVKESGRPEVVIITAPFRGGKTFALQLIREYASEKQPPFDKVRVTLCPYISLREQGISWINIIKGIIIEGGPAPWIGLASQIMKIESTISPENFEERTLRSMSRIFGKEISKLLIKAAKGDIDAEERLKKLFEKKEYLHTIILPNLSEHDALAQLSFMLKTLSKAGISLLLIDELEVLGIEDFSKRQRFLSLLMSLYERDIPGLLLVLACEKKRLNDILVEYDSLNRFRLFELAIKDFTIEDIKVLVNKISKVASIVYKTDIIPSFSEEWYQKIYEETGGRRGEVVQIVANEIIKWYESKAPLEIIRKKVLSKPIDLSKLSDEEFYRKTEEAVFEFLNLLGLEPAYELSLSGGEELTVNIEDEIYSVKILASNKPLTKEQLKEKLSEIKGDNIIVILAGTPALKKGEVEEHLRAVSHNYLLLDFKPDAEELKMLLLLPTLASEEEKKTVVRELSKKQSLLEKIFKEQEY